MPIMVNGRRKGAVYERMVAQWLALNLGVSAERNLDQSRRSGADLRSKPGSLSLDRWAIEAKRQERSSIPAWWRQACQNCAAGQMPALVFKRSHQPQRWAFRWSDIVSLGCANSSITVIDANALAGAVIVNDASAIVILSAGLAKEVVAA